jgi:hypothetical protein
MSERGVRNPEMAAIAAQKQAKYEQGRQAWARDYWNTVSSRATPQTAAALRSEEGETRAERKGRSLSF